MKTESAKDFIRLASTTNGPVATIVKAAMVDSSSGPVIIASMLETALKAAGNSVNYRRDNCTTRCLVTADAATEYDDNNPNIVARAISHDGADAILQAVYAELLEECRLLAAAEKLAANPEFIAGATGATQARLEQLAACYVKPTLLTRELHVAVASDKPLMAELAAL